ncbi:phage tail protein [Brasilonema octagenarum]|uniref:Phage tail protein n=1 Tax=Brasilonema octagenarum UFV-OR1 TaxID=417115 RepID=A0ABX1M207_9CYAN|nr:phage tail protein [Brasilonema octagenarum]NMF62527.1 phage tail protein [Brasilonema octagenarum UFV-OR1]
MVNGKKGNKSNKSSNASNASNGNVNHELNYVTTNRFYVEIDSTIAASFTECSGLGFQIQKNVFHEGGVNDQQRVYLGHIEFTDVTLKRGITDNLGFLNWATKIFDEQNGENNLRQNVNILVFNQAGETMQSWTLIGAIPIGWKSSDLQADGSSVAIEELTLAYEGLKVAKQGGGGNPTTRSKSGFFTSN